MAKASMNPDRAHQGGGVEAGVYEVIGAKYQNLKSDFKENQLHLVLTTLPCDSDGDRVRGADPIDINFSFGNKSLENFHPGKGKSADDPEPEDMGGDVDAEGNTVWCSSGEALNRSCGALVFADTLVNAGYPKPVLDQCWAPNFVGMKFRLETRTSKEINERFHTRLSTKPTKDGNTVTYKICDKWLNPTYLTSGAGASAVASAPAPNGSAADHAKLDSDEDLAKAALAKVAKQRTKSGIKTRQALVGFVTSAYTGAKMPPQKLAAVQTLIKNDDWVTGALMELGAQIEFGEQDGKWTGTVAFPEGA